MTMGETGKDTKDTGKDKGGLNPLASPSAASGGDAGNTPTEDPTLTETQANERVQQALTKAGRDSKTLEEREEALKAGEEGLSEWQKQRDAAEREAVKDDPEKLDVVVERQKLAAREATLKKSEATHAAEIKAANDGKLEITCFKIAGTHGVKPEDLKEAALKYNLTSEELIEDLASRMAKGEPEPPDDKGKKPPAKRPDSGRTKGGGEDWRDLSPDEKIRHATK